MRRALGTGVVAVGALSLVAAAWAGDAEEPKLFGFVGPGFTISLRDAQGQPVRRIPPGEVEIEVEDRATEHNFHLTGPGVDVGTKVETSGSETFKVTLVDGKYTFVCDPHALSMNGDFVATSAPPPPPPVTPKPKPRPKPTAKVGARLSLTVGPGFTISLKTRAGRKVKVLRPGRYTVVVRDRSTIHNARVRGAGASRATSVKFVGKQTWRIKVRKGKLVIQCDPHRSTMRATVRVV